MLKKERASLSAYPPSRWFRYPESPSLNCCCQRNLVVQNGQPEDYEDGCRYHHGGFPTGASCCRQRGRFLEQLILRLGTSVAAFWRTGYQAIHEPVNGMGGPHYLRNGPFGYSHCNRRSYKGRGPAWLKAIIGRARENRANAE